MKRIFLIATLALSTMFVWEQKGKVVSEGNVSSSQKVECNLVNKNECMMADIIPARPKLPPIEPKKIV